MTPDPSNSIVDSLLDEILGGQQPPDLTQRILERFHEQQQVQPPVSSPPRHPARSRSRRRSLGKVVAIAASLLVVATLLGVLAKRLNQPLPISEEGIVEQGQLPGPSHAPADKLAGSNRSVERGPSDDLMAPGSTVVKPFPREELSLPGTEVEKLVIAPRDTIPPISHETMISAVNQRLADSWEQNELGPSQKATDAEWCRRVFLRLIGRIPSAEELQQFLASSQPGQRPRLVEMLLNGDEYIEEYARNWTNLWTNTLIGRRGGMAAEDLSSREGLQQFLRRSFQLNKPYDQMVYELVSATGSNRPGSEHYNGAVNFLLASLGNDNTTLATARITSIFLGQKLQCVQCHNHPFNDVAQNRFWEMDAFFSQLETVKDPQSDVVILLDRDFSSGSEDQPGAEVYYEQPDGQRKAAFPNFLGQGATSRSGELDQFNRREELALQIRYSEHLSRALVNRTWGHFFGYGFTSSVDEMGDHSPVSHPELLGELATQFEAHGYDMKSLFRWLALSDAFSLSSRYSASNLADSPETGAVPAFSRYYTRSMQPEEVYQSLLMVAGVRRGEVPFEQQQLAQRTWLGQFTQRMENDEAEESSSFSGDIHQSLVMMNGPLMQRATSPSQEGVLATVLKSEMPVKQKVEHMFLAAISRRPTVEEGRVVGSMLEAAGDQAAMLQDIWWALLNSNEFILDH